MRLFVILTFAALSWALVLPFNVFHPDRLQHGLFMLGVAIVLYIVTSLYWLVMREIRFMQEHGII